MKRYLEKYDWEGGPPEKKVFYKFKVKVKMCFIVWTNLSLARSPCGSLCHLQHLHHSPLDHPLHLWHVLAPRVLPSSTLTRDHFDFPEEKLAARKTRVRVTKVSLVGIILLFARAGHSSLRQSSNEPLNMKVSCDKLIWLKAFKEGFEIFCNTFHCVLCFLARTRHCNIPPASGKSSSNDPLNHWHGTWCLVH